MAQESSRKEDILSIGDVVIDDFIELAADQAWTYKDDSGKSVLAMEFGTKLPFVGRNVVDAVGNASNGAVALTRLGLKTAFVTDVGDDRYGREIIAALKERGVNTRYVQINRNMSSNYHFVLRYGSERTILIKHEKYDYIWPSIRGAEVPSWVYFSSISDGSLDYHDQIADWLDDHPNVKLAFQPGTFQMDFGVERLKRIYQRSEVLVLNREEAVIVGGGDHENIHDLIDKLHALGPKIVVVTDGPAGAYASDGRRRLKMPLYPDPKEPVDRTGAGDAFASTFVAALAKGHDLESALEMAPINSMSVCQAVGAQAGLLTEEQVERYLKEAPDWYKASEF
jgi:sugar/nucleoside kinase (ribokinase family)